jgi:RHS repeat-associated protein
MGRQHAVDKLTEDKKYSIITDYLGTPAQMYDEQGQVVWEARLDMYGKAANFAGRSLSDCPFRYAGQYEDSETGLYYNRFRYYDPSTGNYLSQDPIGLAGNNPTLYGYVKDSNFEVDILGLAFFRGASEGSLPDFTPRPPVKTPKGWQGDYRLNSDGLVDTKFGVSVFDNAASVSSKGFIPHEIDMGTVPDTLKIVQKAANPHHFEIMPENPMTEADYKADLAKIKCK